MIARVGRLERLKICRYTGMDVDRRFNHASHMQKTDGPSSLQQGSPVMSGLGPDRSSAQKPRTNLATFSSYRQSLVLVYS